MINRKGDKPPQPPPPKVYRRSGHEHSGAREGGEQVFADKAEKRAKAKHRQENN
jgi:hypothetical protein